jgi:hypothetical protein
MLNVPVFVTAAIAIVSLVVSVWIYFREGFPHDWMEQRASNRRSVAIFGLVAAAIGALLLKFIDFVKVAEGSPHPVSSHLLPFLPIATILPILVQALLLKQTDKRDTKLAAETKRADDAEAARDLARKEEFFHFLISQSFLRAVGIKKDHVDGAIQSGSLRIDPSHQADVKAFARKFKDVVSPKRQIGTLIQIVHEIFNKLIISAHGKGDLRVAYFVLDKNGRFVAQYSWNGFTEDCLVTPNKKNHKNRLRINAHGERSVLLSAARSGDILIVENAHADHNDASLPFEFWHQGQRQSIASMVALPLGSANKGDCYSHVVCIDTNVAGFFNKSQHVQLTLVRNNLAQRLLCESGIETLLSIAPDKSTKGQSQ